MNQALQYPQIIAIANQKGGVGKTTTAINLATAFSSIGRRSLIIDLDPQGNASTGLGLDPKDRKKSTYEVMHGECTLNEAIVETDVPKLSLVPSTLDLLGLELEIADAKGRAFRLKNALNKYMRELEDGKVSNYSYIFIDCPPSLNLLTINSLTACDSILVPLQCEFFALEGLSQLLKTVESVKVSLNPQLSILGVVLTMFDSRNNLSSQVVEDVRSTLGKTVFDTVIPRNVRVSEAPSHGKPALIYDLNCSGSKAYIQLATEIIHGDKQIQVAAA